VDVIPVDDPIAISAVEAIHSGDIATLQRLLKENSVLATARLGDERRGGTARSLLHVVTDWPGHFPNGAWREWLRCFDAVQVNDRAVAVLVAAGADVNARFTGPHTETPLHWAASSDDVEVLDALLDAGADIDAPGAVIAGGPPLADAVAFAQWNAARRLVERGAKVRFGDAAALGLLGQVEGYVAENAPGSEETSDAFWLACHGGQRGTAEYLLAHGAQLDWLPGWEKLTPLDAAKRNGFVELAEWLRKLGARSARQLG
jgi:uncharacterized protein